jgi:hypothetical protein
MDAQLQPASASFDWSVREPGIQGVGRANLAASPTRPSGQTRYSPPIAHVNETPELSSATSPKGWAPAGIL